MSIFNPFDIVNSVAGLVSDGVKGFFGMKMGQIDQVNKITGMIGDSETSAASRETAVAQVVTAEATSGFWLAAVWRPMLMCVLMAIVFSYCFGWTTQNLLIDLPEHSMILNCFNLLQIGVCGYMPLRTVEKIVDKLTLSGVLNAWLGVKSSPTVNKVVSDLASENTPTDQ